MRFNVSLYNPFATCRLLILTVFRCNRRKNKIEIGKKGERKRAEKNIQCYQSKIYYPISWLHAIHKQTRHLVSPPRVCQQKIISIMRKRPFVCSFFFIIECAYTFFCWCCWWWGKSRRLDDSTEKKITSEACGNELKKMQIMKSRKNRKEIEIALFE